MKLLRASAAAVFLVCLEGAAVSTLATPPTDAIPWRSFDAAAFDEAERDEKNVFLVVSAPWNWDHFITSARELARPEIAQRVSREFVPVYVDATLYPELRSRYRISSGLLPSFHFLNARGTTLASFPPLAREELEFYLGEFRQLRGAPLPDESKPAESFATRGESVVDLWARRLVDQVREDPEIVVPLHEDLDPAPLQALLDYGIFRKNDGVYAVLDSTLNAVLRSVLFDSIDGGFHRSSAAPSRAIAHWEKTLRVNARMGQFLADWYFRSKREPVGKAALLTLRALNESLRARNQTMYAGSVRADVYDDEGRIAVPGQDYYGILSEQRRNLGRPEHSETIPIGPNFAVQEFLASGFRAFANEDMRDAAPRAWELLREEGFTDRFEPRRALSHESVGTLLDFADVGLGLLSLHGVSGAPEILDRAVEIAEEIRTSFWDRRSSRLRTHSKRSEMPRFSGADAPPNWSGEALRFWVELAAVTRDSKWEGFAKRGLDEWMRGVPQGKGLAELTRAAIRVSRPMVVAVIVADPADAHARALGDLAFRVPDVMARIRWIAPDDSRALRSFGIEAEPEAALYLVSGDHVSPALREEVTLRAAYRTLRQKQLRTN